MNTVFTKHGYSALVLALLSGAVAGCTDNGNGSETNAGAHPDMDTDTDTDSDTDTDTDSDSDTDTDTDTDADTDTDTDSDTDTDADSTPDKIVYKEGNSLFDVPPPGSVEHMVVLRSADGALTASGTRNDYYSLPEGCAKDFNFSLTEKQQFALDNALVEIAGMSCTDYEADTDDPAGPLLTLSIDGMLVYNDFCDQFSDNWDSSAIHSVMAILNRIVLENSNGACIATIKFERGEEYLNDESCPQAGDPISADIYRPFTNYDYEQYYLMEGRVAALDGDAVVVPVDVEPFELTAEQTALLLGLAIRLPSPETTPPVPDECDASAECGAESLTLTPALEADHVDGDDGYYVNGAYRSTWNLGCSSLWSDPAAAQAAADLENELGALLSANR